MPFTSVLIVGANRGIGLGLVERVLKTNPLATVYATARDPEKATALHDLVKTYLNRLVILKADMLDEASLIDTVAELKKRTSSLDLAIFNAGVALGVGKIEDLQSKDFLENLNANVVGPHNLFKAFSPFLLASKSEKRTIAVTSSIGGSITAAHAVGEALKGMFGTDFIALSGYAVTKSAVNMLGRQWAETLEPQGVTIALVHPGAVATDMNPGEGLIQVAESAEGVINVLEKLELADAAAGILSYDGTVNPW